MRICTIGAGYVGLVTAACFAELGHNVISVDNDEKKIRMLKKLKIPIYEPGLEELVVRNVKNGRLRFTVDIGEGVRSADVIFIAVGTPPKEDGSADLSSVEAVARAIAENMDSYKVVVEKSTVPVETGEWVKRTLQLYRKKDVSFDVVSNPEFLREGSAVEDFLHPSRIVIGVESKRAEKIMREVYAKIKAPILVTDIKSAELIKHASNSFLATKISYINAIANICELVGADVVKVAEGMGLDKRIGREFLDAGCGFGGFCLPKDLASFKWICNKLGYNFKLLEVVEEINESQKRKVVEKLEKLLWNINGKVIGVLGLSFKPNTDDIRFSAAIDIIKLLLSRGAIVKVYDPRAMEKSKAVLGKRVTYCKDPYSVSKGSDALVILTGWEEFKNLDYKKIKRLLRVPVVVDGRNILDRDEMKKLGFMYEGIGR
jgi:UDPglucose 6-dehydrogenase